MEVEWVDFSSCQLYVEKSSGPLEFWQPSVCKIIFPFGKYFNKIFILICLQHKHEVNAFESLLGRVN